MSYFYILVFAIPIRCFIATIIADVVLKLIILFIKKQNSIIYESVDDFSSNIDCEVIEFCCPIVNLVVLYSFIAFLIEYTYIWLTIKLFSDINLFHSNREVVNFMQTSDKKEYTNNERLRSYRGKFKQIAGRLQHHGIYSVIEDYSATTLGEKWSSFSFDENSDLGQIYNYYLNYTNTEIEELFCNLVDVLYPLMEIPLTTELLNEIKQLIQKYKLSMCNIVERIKLAQINEAKIRQQQQEQYSKLALSKLKEVSQALEATYLVNNKNLEDINDSNR